jgi:hypothetical protein
MRLLVPALAAHSAVKNAQLRSCGEPWLALPFRWSSTGGRGEGGEVSCDEEIWHHVWGLHGPGNRPGTCTGAHGSKRQAAVALWFLDK